LKFLYVNSNLNFDINIYNFEKKTISKEFFFKYFSIFKKKFIKLHNYKQIRHNYINSRASLKSDVSNFNKLLNVSMYKGKKQTCFKNYNLFLHEFYNIFIEYDDNLNKFKYYDVLFKLLSVKKEYYNFNKFLTYIIPVYNSVFSINLRKLNKSQRLKFQRTHVQELVYIKPKNRLKLSLKLINFFSFKYKHNLYWKRLYLFFLPFFLDPKQSFLWNRRALIYDKALRAYLKKN